MALLTRNWENVQNNCDLWQFICNTHTQTCTGNNIHDTSNNKNITIFFLSANLKHIIMNVRVTWNWEWFYQPKGTGDNIYILFKGLQQLISLFEYTRLQKNFATMIYNRKQKDELLWKCPWLHDNKLNKNNNHYECLTIAKPERIYYLWLNSFITW